MKKLNLGCHNSPLPGYLNVDLRPFVGVDEIVDLQKLPWPWPIAEFSHVRAVDILEHLGKITKHEAVRELARVTESYGTVFIRVPCATHRWALAALEHAHSFYFNSFDPWYDQPWFRVRKIQVGYGYMVPKKFFYVTYNQITRPFIKFLTIFGIGQCITFDLERL